jgi:hypothetical protein
MKEERLTWPAHWQTTTTTYLVGNIEKMFGSLAIAYEDAEDPDFNGYYASDLSWKCLGPFLSNELPPAAPGELREVSRGQTTFDSPEIIEANQQRFKRAKLVFGFFDGFPTTIRDRDEIVLAHALGKCVALCLTPEAAGLWEEFLPGLLNKADLIFVDKKPRRVLYRAARLAKTRIGFRKFATPDGRKILEGVTPEPLPPRPSPPPPRRWKYSSQSINGRRLTIFDGDKPRRALGAEPDHAERELFQVVQGDKPDEPIVRFVIRPDGPSGDDDGPKAA